MRAAIDEIGHENCTGCFGCYNVCPIDAIDFELDNDGFLTPVVDRDKCIKCGICQKHCPVLVYNKEERNQYEKQVFAAWSLNDDVRLNSSSGGVFTELAKQIVQEDGIVYGAAIDANKKLQHIKVDCEEGLELLRGSKYLQSRVGNCYQEAIQAAEAGRQVFFTGTPCQIAAINIRADKARCNGRILTCEVICHGVPSEHVFTMYLSHLSNTMGSSPDTVSFRDKRHGWADYGMSITFQNGSEYHKKHRLDPFMIGYLKNIYLRKCCYSCRFSKPTRHADLTLGDFWGVPVELDDKRGVSVVIANSRKGKQLLERVSDISMTSVDMEAVSRCNPRLVSGELEIPSVREPFFDDIRTRNFEYIIDHYLRPPSLYRRLINGIIRRLCRLKRCILNSR